MKHLNLIELSFYKRTDERVNLPDVSESVEAQKQAYLI